MEEKKDNNSSTKDNETNNNKEIDNGILSPEEFKKLYNKLHSIITENKKLDKIKQEFIEILESTTEHLINGDKKDPKIFELFSSLNFIRDLIVIMSKKNKEINIQIIKFFSVLMTNLSETHILYFLFNCDFINQHVYEENESIEGDYLYYYISFVKSLILKISTKTIGFFYHAQTYSFPLLGNCLKFYNHPDTMISNTARNIFLFILKMKHPPCIDYICSLPMLSYFIFLSCRLRDEIKTINKKIIRNKEEDCKILYEEIINDIMYMQDIFSIGLDKINYILINCIFHYLILPVICNSIVYYSDFNTNMDYNIGGKEDNFNFFFNINNKSNSNTNINPLLKNCISPELAIYILNVFLKYIKNDTFINLLLSLLFLPKIHYKTMNKLKIQTKDLENYEGDYNKNAKKIEFIKYVIQNFCQPFIKAQVDNPNKTFNEFNKIEKKLREKLKDYKINYNLSQPVPFGFLMEILNGYFSNKELNECREYHEIVSESTGIQCGLTYRCDRKCFIYLMQKNLAYIKNDFSYEKIEKKLVDNEIFSSLINCYKDCSELCLFLLNYFFHQIINNEFVSKHLLNYIKFVNPHEINQNNLSNAEEEDTPALQVGALIESKEEKKEKKKILDEPITFSNFYKVMYKKDFIIKEFNFYDNNILSNFFYNRQYEYNNKLLGNAISYINRDYVLKPETYLFILNLINDLILYEENNEKKYLKIRNIHKSIIKNAFVQNIEKIKNIINEGEININELKMIYSFLWGKTDNLSIFEDYSKLANNIMNNCLFLLSKDVIEDKNICSTQGADIFNNLLINNADLKTRIYFFKGILKIYLGIFEIKENEIKLDELKDENINDIKKIIIDNFNKLIPKENN